MYNALNKEQIVPVRSVLLDPKLSVPKWPVKALVMTTPAITPQPATASRASRLQRE
jgi:hypothetical protein